MENLKNMEENNKETNVETGGFLKKFMQFNLLKSARDAIRDSDNDSDDENDDSIIDEFKKNYESMREVLQVSVTETVINDYRDLNEAHITKNDDVMYIGALVSAKKIGGISRKSSKEHALLIQQISSGDIKTYVSEELLEKEELFFVPTRETWNYLSEYEFIRNAKYRLTLLDEEGNLEKSKAIVTFDEIKQYIYNFKSLAKLLKKKEEEFAQEQALKQLQEQKLEQQKERELEEAQEQMQEIAQEQEQMQELSQEQEQMQELSQEQEEDDYRNQFMGEEDDIMLIGVLETNNNDIEDNEIEDIEDNEIEDEEINPEEIDKMLLRKFYPNDLDLEISLQPFISQFEMPSDIVPFETNREEGWINEQLNVMSANFNQEIEQMHKSHLSKLRIIYGKLMQESAEKVKEAVDINDPSNFYGKKYAELMNEMNGYNIDQVVTERKSILTKEWAEKLQQVGEDARNLAIQKYKDKYEREYEDKKFQLRIIVQNEIDEEFREHKNKLFEKRNLDANAKFEQYTTAILKRLADEYLEMQKEEQDKIQSMQDEIQKFIDENRKNDIAASQIRQHELESNQRLQEEMDKHKKEIAEYQQQLSDIEAKHRNEIDAINHTNKQLMEENCKQHELDYTKLENMYKEQIACTEKLKNENQNIEEKLKEQHKQEIIDMQNTNEELSEIVLKQKKNMTFILCIVVIAIIIAMIVGVFIGTAMATPTTSLV